MIRLIAWIAGVAIAIACAACQGGATCEVSGSLLDGHVTEVRCPNGYTWRESDGGTPDPAQMQR